MSDANNIANVTGNVSAAAIIEKLKANAKQPTADKCLCGVDRGSVIDHRQHSEACVREMFEKIQGDGIAMGFEIDDLSAITTTLANIVEYLLNDFRENVRCADYPFAENILLPIVHDQVGDLAFWSIRRWGAIREFKKWLIDQRIDHMIDFAAHRDQDLCVRFRDMQSAAMFRLRWVSEQ